MAVLEGTVRDPSGERYTVRLRCNEQGFIIIDPAASGAQPLNATLTALASAPLTTGVPKLTPPTTTVLPITPLGETLLNSASAADLRNAAQLSAVRPTSGGISVGNDPANSPYALSVKSTSPFCYLEITNNGLVNQGAFFGMSNNKFELYNWQGGDTTVSTGAAPSQANFTWTFSNTGHLQLPGGVAPKYYTPGTLPAATALPYCSIVAVFVGGAADTYLAYAGYRSATDWFKLQGTQPL